MWIWRGTPSVNNENCCATRGPSAVRRTIVISHVITCSRRKSQHPTVLMLDRHLTGNNEGQVAFMTPVIANVRRAVFDHPKLYLTELARADDGDSGFARVF